MCKLLDHLVTDEQCWLSRTALWVFHRPKWMAAIVGMSSLASALLNWFG